MSNENKQTSTEDVLKRLGHLVEDGLDQRDGELEWGAKDAIKEIKRLRGGGWQDIKSAPKKGIILTGFDYGLFGGRWVTTKTKIFKGKFYNFDTGMEVNASSWMKQPEPPKGFHYDPR